MAKDSKHAVSLVFKTTGFDPKVDEPVIIALAKFTANGVDPGDAEEFLIRPDSARLRPEARAAYNIDHALARRIEAEGLSQMEARAKVLDFIGDAPLACHALERAKEFLPWLCEDRVLLDSLRLARHSWPSGSERAGFKLETHKVFEIKYWLGLEQDMMNAEPTTAFAEAIVAGAVISEAAKLRPEAERGWQALSDLAQTPIHLPAYPNGKLVGKPFDSLDFDFIKRELSPDREKPLDFDLRHALEQELGRRREQIHTEARQRSFFSRPAA